MELGSFDWTWMLRGLAGGALIGAAASLMLALSGRVAGISGIVLGLLVPAEPLRERAWRALFVVGLLAGGGIGLAMLPEALAEPAPPVAIAVAAGALVGAGTRLGKGCTSGHGVCGISRFSARSIVATITFIATGAITVLLTKIAGGAA